MPQSLARIVVHLIFSTKNRKPWLQQENVRDELYRYMAGTLKTLECVPITINGVEDHVHLLFGMSRNHPVKKIVGEVKSDSSLWIKRKGGAYEEFFWQAGYGIFSVSESNVEVVKQYIRNQEEKHKQISFKEEFRRICERHGVEIDERYVWD